MQLSIRNVCHVFIFSLLALAVALSARPSLAASGTSVMSGNWTTTSTWSATPYPQVYNSGGTGGGDSATINGGFEVTFNAASGTVAVFAASIGNTTAGTLTVDGGTLTIGGRLTMSNTATGGAGTLNLKSGTLNVQGVGTSGDLDSPNTNSRALRLGYRGTATFNQTGGLFNYTIVNDFADYGTSANSPGAVNMSITGGTFQTTARNIEFGGNASGSVVTWTIGDGTGSALFHQSSGSGGYFSKGGKATVNLNANGTLRIYGFNLGTGGTSDSSFNFDGGTLKAKASLDMLPSSIFNGTTMASVFVKENGAILDSDGNNPSISAALKHGGSAATDGGLTKVGSGTWTLSGTAANTYNGTTTVNGGTLILQKPINVNAVAGDVTIGNGTDPAMLQLNQSNQIDNASVMTINSGGKFDLHGFGETIAGIQGSGTVDNSSATAVTLVVNANSPNFTFSGDITQTGGGALSLWKQSANTVELSSTTNDYSGAIRIYNGALVVHSLGDSGVGSNGSGDIVLVNGANTATLQYLGGGATTSRQFLITPTGLGLTESTGGTAVIDSSGTGALVLNGNIIGAAATMHAKTLRLQGSFYGTVGGLISNGTGSGAMLSLEKLGNGTWILSGNNIYTGTTNVNAGTLLINGDQSAANGLVTVAPNGTLGGFGTIGGDTVIQGTHSPGTSPGIQTFATNLTYQNGGTPDPSVIWELTDNTINNVPNPNALFDTIIVGGDLNFASLTSLNLVFDSLGSAVDWSDSFWETSHLGIDGWLLYEVGGTTIGFDNLSLTAFDWLDGNQEPFSSLLPGSSFSLVQIDDNIYLEYNVAATDVVPEPAMVGPALIGLAWLLLCICRRKRGANRSRPV